MAAITLQPKVEGDSDGDGLVDIEFGISKPAAIMFWACLPCTMCCGWYQLNPREQVVLLNYGILTGSQTPSFHVGFFRASGELLFRRRFA